jgi:hypothetical protein
MTDAVVKLVDALALIADRKEMQARIATLEKERDKLREELESARLFIDCYLMAGEQETGKALANYIARFGGRDHE